MNLPNLPTDNLYKFISIFGLAILVFSQIWKFEVDKEAHRLGSNIISTESELILLQDDITRTNSFIEKRRKIYVSATNDSISDSELADQMILDQKRLEKEKAELMADYNIKVTNINRDQDNFNRWLELTNWSWIFIVLNIIGITLFISGLYFWYFKHQRYIDAEKKLTGDKVLLKLKKQNKKAKEK